MMHPRLPRERGFSYLAVLFLVALTAAGLAALGQAWSTAAQRERERELAFRGGEIARAISAYLRAAPPGQLPASLDDLLEDRRGPSPRHHLRRRYADPFTGEPDWVLLPDAAQPGRFGAVHSRSTQPLLRAAAPDGSPLRSAQDWVFAAAGYDAAAGPAGPASGAASAPGLPVLP
ncbi:MAG: type II secretion system protein [Roseateles sp.]|uniref:type II secretion system protein n=1 Tax=Roseateles sp. TaxID=1971397 RepID=UPI0039E74F6B